MYTPIYHRFFKKDIQREKSSGKFSLEDFATLKEVMSALINGETLDEKYKNHTLGGEWRGALECHIKNDWILVYEIYAKSNEIVFLRLGIHAQIFKKFK